MHVLVCVQRALHGVLELVSERGLHRNIQIPCMCLSVISEPCMGVPPHGAKKKHSIYLYYMKLPRLPRHEKAS